MVRNKKLLNLELLEELIESKTKFKDVSLNFDLRLDESSLSKKEIEKGIDEINLNFKNQLNFTDTLKCISFRK